MNQCSTEHPWGNNPPRCPPPKLPCSSAIQINSPATVVGQSTSGEVRVPYLCGFPPGLQSIPHLRCPEPVGSSSPPLPADVWALELPQHRSEDARTREKPSPQRLSFWRWFHTGGAKDDWRWGWCNLRRSGDKKYWDVVWFLPQLVSNPEDELMLWFKPPSLLPPATSVWIRVK